MESAVHFINVSYDALHCEVAASLLLFNANAPYGNPKFDIFVFWILDDMVVKICSTYKRINDTIQIYSIFYFCASLKPCKPR